MTPYCLKLGFNEKMPKYSIVGLYCDFNNDNLRNLGLNNINQLTKIVSPQTEIIIVANNISDTFMLELKKIKDIIVVSTNVNLGCVVKNIGYEIAQGEYIFSIDHDVFVENNKAFDKCVNFLDKNPKTAILGPCGGNLLKEFWSSTDWGVGEHDKRKHIFGYDDPINFGTHEHLDGTSVDTIPSMFWCFRKKLLKEIGFLDWRFGPFVGSDTDFCFRAKEAGYNINIMRVPIKHINGGGCSHKNQSDLDEIRANHVKALYEKWYPKLNFICENYKK